MRVHPPFPSHSPRHYANLNCNQKLYCYFHLNDTGKLKSIHILKYELPTFQTNDKRIPSYQLNGFSFNNRCVLLSPDMWCVLLKDSQSMVYSLWAVNTLASVPVKQFVVQQLLRGLVRRLCQVVHLPCVTNASESRYVMTS